MFPFFIIKNCSKKKKKKGGKEKMTPVDCQPLEEGLPARVWGQDEAGWVGLKTLLTPFLKVYAAPAL